MGDILSQWTCYLCGNTRNMVIFVDRNPSAGSSTGATALPPQAGKSWNEKSEVVGITIWLWLIQPWRIPYKWWFLAGKIIYNPKQLDLSFMYRYWLVVSSHSKNMSSSIGLMKFPMYWKIKVMFQTTNQIITGWIGLWLLPPNPGTPADSLTGRMYIVATVWQWLVTLSEKKQSVPSGFQSLLRFSVAWDDSRV